MKLPTSEEHFVLMKLNGQMIIGLMLLEKALLLKNKKAQEFIVIYLVKIVK
jgi:hypothetical protein